MNMRSRVTQSLREMQVDFTKNRSLRWTAVLLILMLIADVLPVAAVSTPFNPIDGSDLQATSTLTFISEADAQVEENNPDSNTGTSSDLEVINANNRSIESYLRFTVSGTSGTIQTALLRVYSTSNSTRNGPAVYATGSSWTETGITWNNRPARTSGAADNKGSIGTNIWVEYDVTSLVTGNGTFSFVLAADSTDGVTFSSRQGAQA